MRLQNCKHFNGEEFLKNLKGWKKEKERLLKDLEEISELPAIENQTGVRGSDVSDPTTQQVLKRAKIQSQIDDIEYCEKAFECVMEMLSKEEQEIINGFFFPKIPIWKFVRKMESERYIGSTLVYKERRLAVERFSKLMEKTYKL